MSFENSQSPARVIPSHIIAGLAASALSNGADPAVAFGDRDTALLIGP